MLLRVSHLLELQLSNLDLHLVSVRRHSEGNLGVVVKEERLAKFAWW